MRSRVAPLARAWRGAGAGRSALGLAGDRRAGAGRLAAARAQRAVPRRRGGAAGAARGARLGDPRGSPRALPRPAQPDRCAPRSPTSTGPARRPARWSPRSASGLSAFVLLAAVQTSLDANIMRSVPARRARLFRARRSHGPRRRFPRAWRDERAPGATVEAVPTLRGTILAYGPEATDPRRRAAWTSCPKAPGRCAASAG